MNIIGSIQEMQKLTRELRSTNKKIGFVPTMGFLHEGHLELIKAARQENDIVILSIFVNPLQFGPNEDFDHYPRDIRRDEILAKEADVDILFYPGKEEMYPDGYGIAKLQVIDRVDVLCGKSREGHFDGVATVVMKLFNSVQPDHAYFGLKDAQQVAVIEGIVKDFNIPVGLRMVQTVREKDGLAKSSRNVYLTKSERSSANELYQALKIAKSLIQEGERDSSKLNQMITAHIQNETSGTIDYVELLSYPGLKNIDKLHGKIIIALAVKFSRARLIDNLIIELE